MSNFETPEHQAAYFAGMTLDAFTSREDMAVRFAESGEGEGDRGTYLTEYDFEAAELADEEDAWYAENFDRIIAEEWGL